MKDVLMILLFVLFIYSCNNSSQKIIIDNSLLDRVCMSRIDDFFKIMQSKNYSIALDSLLLSNENIDLQDSSAINLKKQFININELSGKYLGSKLLKKKNVADDIGIYSYLAKYEKKFYRFVFIFYNTGEKIKIYKFKFDDVIDIELEESLKLYI